MSESITKERETVWMLEDSMTTYRIALLQQLKATNLTEKKEAFEEKKVALHEMQQILEELSEFVRKEEMFAAGAVAEDD